ncbi:MAG: Snf7 family protein [Candidatus Bathyarchaeia archaeon]
MLGGSRLSRLRRRKEEPLKDRVATAIFLLESTTNKLKTLSESLAKKDEKYFEHCVRAIISEDMARARMYANECAEIRRFARLILSSQLALEQATLRLNTISTISDVLTNITPVMAIVQETGSRLKGIVPSVTGRLQEVDNLLKSSLLNMGTASGDSAKTDTEAQRILEDANKAAEETIRSKFPELPNTFTEKTSEKVPVALLETGANETELAEKCLKEQVYNYLKSCRGEVSITECAAKLQASPRDIEKTILQLKDEGKVFIG